MEFTFFKFQGTGNDFIMLDNRNDSFSTGRDLIARLCDRRFGIGADGLILLENHEEADFRMVYFNADGHESTFCGNGGRCAVAFARQLGIISNFTRFIARDGWHEATFSGAEVRLKMRDCSIPAQHNGGFFLDTGSPHLVLVVKEPEEVNVVEEGRQLRNAFSPEGVNVNFISFHPGHIGIRTYERGVENETYSCGTGVTAAALVASFLQEYSSPVSVRTNGGNLQVEFLHASEGFVQVFLTGPAECVFEGRFLLPE